MSLFQNLRVWLWTVSGTEEAAQAGLAVEVTPMTTAARRRVSMALRRWVEAGTPEATGGRLEEVFRPEEEVSLVLACPLLLSPSYCRLRNASGPSPHSPENLQLSLGFKKTHGG